MEHLLHWHKQIIIMTDAINTLLRLNLDASKGYEFAASSIENENFRHFLEAYSRKRKRYAEELSEIVTQLRGKPNLNTTIKGDLHKALMEFRKSVTSSIDAALLEECVRGEGEAIEQYKKVLSVDKLSRDHRQTLMTQFDKIKAAKKTMEELERVV
jgi:uncharacterized protein (TIGR02284 family)